jgi:hypothetical protein
MENSVKRIVSALVANDFENVMHIWKRSPYCDEICEIDKSDCEKGDQQLKCVGYLEDMLATMSVEKQDPNLQYFARQVKQNREILRPISSRVKLRTA